MMIFLTQAFAAMKNAYAPYSKYHVGACVKTKDGTYIQGANIENASYGLSNCAERSAYLQLILKAIASRILFLLAIVSDGKRIGTPCGACRQVLVELLEKDTPIVLSNGKDTLVTTIAELLPMSFDSEDLS